ncbi:MAG: hypothetical protein M1819_004944 [Sarea resinae]|nr:MAG: hypothetical protein M1819_004944 [Sarea resinae]
MIAVRETEIYRRDGSQDGPNLTPKAREKLLEPYLPRSLPKSKSAAAKKRPGRRPSIRQFLETQLHILLFTILHTVFSAYIRLRQAYHAIVNRVFAILYYHHRTPELIKNDVAGLSKLPEHLSVILDYKEEEKGGAGLEGLIDELSEVAAWCACAGIPVLSVYEKTGILKDYIPSTHTAVSQKFHAYFGRGRPSLQIRAPHMAAFLNGDNFEQPSPSPTGSRGHLSILLLSSEDGRSTLVDLTKTLAEMAQRRKLSASDISVELVDAEISESVMGEPDLLLLFAPYVRLQGYPPWQIRLSEIFHAQDNQGVEYQVFLRALHRYSKVEMKLGR